MTLKRTSIEDYLLVPRSIKAAIPSLSLDEKRIASFLESNAGKRNKKAVLDELLKKYADVKYDGAIGAKIASCMRIVDMDSEIRGIFSSL